MADNGIYVTESQLAGVLEEFYLEIRESGSTRFTHHGVVHGQVADPDRVAKSLYATLSTYAALSDDEPSPWPATRGELETRLSVALRRIPILAWKGDIEDDAGHGSGFALVAPHDPASLAGVLADDIAGQCAHREPADAPPAAPSPLWPMGRTQMQELLCEALRGTDILIHGSSVDALDDGEHARVKADQPAALAAELLDVIDSLGYYAPAPPEPPRLAHAGEDDELFILWAVYEQLDALRAVGGDDAVARGLAYLNDRFARRVIT